MPEPSSPPSQTPLRARSPLSLRKRIIFAAAPSLVLAILLLTGWWWLFPKRGSALSQYAWQRTYLDRKGAVPAHGPRDGGFRGERIFPKIPHAATVWCEPTVSVPGILEIDDNGRQFYRPVAETTREILILGGSVASGTYASSTTMTYFGQLGSLLVETSHPTSITVFAAGAWKSAQEVAAMEDSIGSGMRPDLAIFINGLNDLTNGGTALALFGEPTATKDGSRWTKLYHGHDYSQRVKHYLQNMQRAVDFAREHQFPVLIVLQPALFEREPLTPVERQLLWASLAPHKSKQILVDSYAQLRTGLKSLADNKHVYFVDASRIFNGEAATTFTDMWHFSDFGHQILAVTLVPTVRQILDSRTSPPAASQ